MKQTYKLIFIALLLIGLCVGVVQATTYLSDYDPDLKLLINFNGTQGSTVFSDSTGRHTVTTVETVNVNTTVKQLGTGSGNFSRQGWLNVSKSTDWDLPNNFTMVFWWQSNVTTIPTGQYPQYLGTETATGTGKPWTIHSLSNGNTIRVQITNTSGTTTTANLGAFENGAFHQYAVIKAGTNLSTYRDGVLVESAEFIGTVMASTDVVKIGKWTAPADFANGHMDSAAMWHTNIPIEELYPQTYEVGQTIPSPTASFSSFNTAGTAPFTTYLYDTSTNLTPGPVTYLTDFGDGNTSTEANTYYTWNITGEYNVTHTVSNGLSSETSFMNVTVGTPTPPVVAPVASFYGSPTTGNVPLTVFFTDVSSNAPTSWFWEFGDGTNSTLQNPTHTYTRSGFRTVNLTATNSAGSNVTTRLKFVKVS